MSPRRPRRRLIVVPDLEARRRQPGEGQPWQVGRWEDVSEWGPTWEIWGGGETEGEAWADARDRWGIVPARQMELFG